MKPDYDTTLARIAGNIAAGMVSNGDPLDTVARDSVDLAVRIVARVRALDRRDIAAILDHAELGLEIPPT